MIGAIFKYGIQLVEVRVIDKKVLFRTSQFNSSFADIKGIKLNQEGCIKEFPDLIDKEDWREQTIERFQEKINNLQSEKDRIEYIIEDLTKHGYEPKYIQKQGFRPIKIK